MSVRLAKVWGCRPSQVMMERADLVLAAIQYEHFVDDYQAECIELNKGGADK